MIFWFGFSLLIWVSSINYSIPIGIFPDVVSFNRFFLKLKPGWSRSETTLNCWMMVLRYPNLKEEVGGSFPNCEISSLLDRNLLGGQSHHVLWRWPVGLLSIWFYLKKPRDGPHSKIANLLEVIVIHNIHLSLRVHLLQNRNSISHGMTFGWVSMASQFHDKGLWYVCHVYLSYCKSCWF